MVVDDDELLRESLTALLAGRGFRVVEHGSGSAALAALVYGERPDLILLDMVMPQMDGLEFRQRQLADTALASIPVVAVSGSSLAKHSTVNAAAFISKPLVATELLSTVEDVLARSAHSPPDRTPTQRGLSPRAQLRRRQARSGARAPGRRFGTAQQEEAQRRLQLRYVSQAVSHLVNNALQGLISYAHCVANGAAEDSELGRVAIEGGLRCGELMRKFSECTSRGDCTDGREPPLPGASVSILEEMRALCPHGIEMRVAGLQRLAGACVTQATLRLLMRELNSNAAEALADKNGVVQVRVSHERRRLRDLSATLPACNRRAGLFCCIEVSDDGCGMRPIELSRIWLPFYSTKFAGRGLGLALVLARVQALAGLVEAASEPGRGTTIRLLLPLAPGAAHLRP